MAVGPAIWGLLCATIGWGCADVVEPENELQADQDTPAEFVALEQAEDGTIALPSGLVVRQHELRLEPAGVPIDSVSTIRLRYVSEQLADADSFPFERIEAAFGHLCGNFGLQAVRKSAPNAEQIIVSIASQPTAFGESVPEVVQYFDSFRVEGARCIWEGI